jgi:hypothetical protein
MRLTQHYHDAGAGLSRPPVAASEPFCFRGNVFLDVVMPSRFVLECLDQGGAWVPHGLYETRQFSRDEDGVYVCAGHGGSPLFLRCLKQDGQVIHVVDGSGQPFAYRMVPVADPV